MAFQAYAKALSAAGVPAQYLCWEGQFHGSQAFDTIIPEEAAAYRAQIIGFLAKAYEPVAA